MFSPIEVVNQQLDEALDMQKKFEEMVSGVENAWADGDIMSKRIALQNQVVYLAEKLFYMKREDGMAPICCNKAAAII